MVLQGIGLEKHFTHLFRKGINWDSFANLTAEDMHYLDIPDPEEQKALLEILSTMKIPYTEYDETPDLNVPEILEDTVKVIRRLRAGMILAKKELEDYNTVSTMIDSKTQATVPLKQLLKILDEGTDKLEKEIYSSLKTISKVLLLSSLRSRRKVLFSVRKIFFLTYTFLSGNIRFKGS
ncbi:hypothetical protein O3M35_012028 [Rhynocoris fuscipes]|uniref:Uncharacterized protein n=1 Tax=Rhynocoris fuscipes TaxID=488301 RepID=A0AAW1CSB7_9HEMI